MTIGGSFRGATLDKALTSACAELRARVGELRYDVVEDACDDEVVISAEVDAEAVLGLFLSETFRAGGLDVVARLSLRDSVLEGELSGEDMNVFTSGGGRGLDALQYLCNRVLKRRIREHLPVHLDGGGFKARRARQLQEKAEAAADEAARRRSSVTLGPLTPAARREIHVALADDPRVETESDGEGFLKRIVVRPAGRR